MGRIDETPINDPKNKDWYLFRPADDFFDSLQGAVRPTSVTYEDDDQKKSDGQDNPACSHGRVFRFNDNLGFVLIQFMRPHIWRIRFHHVNQSGAGFSDYNTRTIVQDTLSAMIKILDVAEQVNWQVELQTEDTRYFILQSVIDPGLSTQRVGVQLWIQRNPFRITAVRSVRAASASAILPQLQAPIDASVASKLRIEETQGKNNAIIWQTKVRPLQYIQDAAILSVEKPHMARYAGFGEQGGKRMFKDNVFMNYFNFDNMRYYNVYGEGPLKDDEPLYHSEPYWIEMNAHPGHLSQVGYFVDNYSQVCVDLGKTDPTTIRIATRFNSFQCIIMAGDDVGDIIRSYTSIIGRPNLKPRFILGNHQGCYGYDKQWKVTQAVDKYRQYGIPLDGMHVDVDIQRDYRTFTIDTRTFPDPKGMFSDLRNKGVKCSTNITPVINMRPDSTYTTLNEGLQDGYFVKDVRELDPSAQSPSQQRCLDFGNGHRYFKDPNKKNNFNIDSEKDNRPPFSPPDDYDFDKVFNSGQPFHGAVHYGGDRGAPGHYPNLNSQKVRDWWGKQYQYLFDTGLEFVWQDMTSPCMAKEYGDMRSFPFRLLLDSDGWSGDPHADAQKKAIEIWSLYSYNLHKATFQGLSVLPGREGKRNFIIGRGSFAGAQRYAGLWTGDNVSSWEFFDISVAQVLSLSLAGVLISGADVGGFEPLDGIEENLCADPELLIRWYCAYSLLPWFRNHYTAKPGKKSFQEPYAYIEWFNNNSQRIPSTDYRMWWAVLPVCRYVIQLRYSLLQLMYDAMFENLWTGLPIARAMIVTDPMDASLYQTNQWYTRSQYLVRNDLLVAPALYKERVRDRRKLYLPYPDSWYPMNLRPRWNDNASLGMPLGALTRGGSYINYDCRISPDESQLPYVNPMYIREGAIIPQIEVRQSVPDRSRFPNEPAIPVTINVYPGKDRVKGLYKDESYNMYLDDGVSRESAPDNVYLSALTDDAESSDKKLLTDCYGDKQAASKFRHVRVEQTTTRSIISSQLHETRTVTITSPHSDYSDDQVKRDIGAEYKIVFWHDLDTNVNLNDVKADITSIGNSRSAQDWNARATVAWIPTSKVDKTVIKVSYPV